MTTTIPTIHVHPVDEYRCSSYGIRLESMNYKLSGAGVRNPHFPHQVQVWSNTHRPNPTGETQYLDPSNRPTNDPETLVLSAHGFAIDGRSRLEYAADTLHLGDLVRIDRPDRIGQQVYRVTKRYLADPELVPVEVTPVNQGLPVIRFSEDADFDTFFSVLSGWTVEVVTTTGVYTGVIHWSDTDRCHYVYDEQRRMRLLSLDDETLEAVEGVTVL